MNKKTDENSLSTFIHKIGYDVDKTILKYIDIKQQQFFDFLPELSMFATTYVVKKNFTRKTFAPKAIEDCICFFFLNTIENIDRKKCKVAGLTPRVSIYPATASQMSFFKKGTYKEIVSIAVSATYLKSFLGLDAQKFQFLFDKYHNFLIEEIMTDDILRTVNDILKSEPSKELNAFHYKLKALQLLFYLFKSLNNRSYLVHKALSEHDIDAIYKVKNKIESSLDKPTPIAELKQIAGMNELKMRELFTQIFGMGIYDFYQHLRMKEAARLLREEKLSVSEVGYQLGFENLSHFTKVFEKHIGQKPKRYSIDLL
ncbi:helix-turn-helix domain-containing protein [Rhizosphaericola mali]|uniref:Helix-turn-helix transcriptional regulator n=1 Tax=Rhizosphaericola mali TaxID=2545455 RepID=A0A5P2GA61_9BACT|nr:AraC family transcriptional regulator [Rhizosphaericola mali]QES88431.1 helix-turn-helix transcriptional regulator [Rhizosphaericola mali]